MHFANEPSPGPQIPPRSPRRRTKPKPFRQPAQPDPRPWGVPPAKRASRSRKPQPFLAKWLALENRPGPAPPRLLKPKPTPKPELIEAGSVDKATQRTVEAMDAATVMPRHDDDEDAARCEVQRLAEKLGTMRLAAEASRRDAEAMREDHEKLRVKAEQLPRDNAYLLAENARLKSQARDDAPLAAAVAHAATAQAELRAASERASAECVAFGTKERATQDRNREAAAAATETIRQSRRDLDAATTANAALVRDHELALKEKVAAQTQIAAAQKRAADAEVAAATTTTKAEAATAGAARKLIQELEAAAATAAEAHRRELAAATTKAEAAAAGAAQKQRQAATALEEKLATARADQKAQAARHNTLADDNERLRRAHADVQRQIAPLEALAAKVPELTAANGDLRQKAEQRAGQASDLSTKNVALAQERAELRSAVDEGRRRADTLEARAKKLVEEREALQRANAKLMSAGEAMKRSVSALEAGRAKEKRDGEDAGAALAAATAEWREKTRALEAAATASEIRANKLDVALQKTREELAAWPVKHENLERKLAASNKLARDLAAKHKAHGDAAAARAAGATELTTKNIKLAAEAAELRSHLAEATARLEELEKKAERVPALVAANEALEATHAQLRREADDAKGVLEARLAKAGAELAALTKQNGTLRSERDAATERTNAAAQDRDAAGVLEARLEKAGAEIAALTQQRAEGREKMTALEATAFCVPALQAEGKKLIAERDAVTKRAERLKAEHAQALGALEARLAKAAADREALTKQNTALATKRDDARKQVAGLERCADCVPDLAKSVAALQAENAQLREGGDAARRRADDAMAELKADNSKLRAAIDDALRPPPPQRGESPTRTLAEVDLGRTGRGRSSTSSVASSESGFAGLQSLQRELEERRAAEPEKKSMSSRARATVGKHVGWVKGTMLAKHASTPKQTTPRNVATPTFLTACSKRTDRTPASSIDDVEYDFQPAAEVESPPPPTSPPPPSPAISPEQLTDLLGKKALTAEESALVKGALRAGRPASRTDMDFLADTTT